jgi:hypothetical protein
MAISSEQYKMAMQGFLKRHASHFRKTCEATAGIAITSLDSYIQSDDPFFKYEDLRLWARNHISIFRRPGILKSPESLGRKLNAVFVSRDSAFWNILNGEWPLNNKGIRLLDDLIIEHIQDITGIEVLLPISRMVDQYSKHLLAEVKRSAGHQYHQTRNYWDTGQEDGYRALHVVFKFGRYWSEVQMKTYLSKSWEHYTHDLFYKDPRLGGTQSNMQERLKDLSLLLQICDRTADHLMGDFSVERTNVAVVLTPSGK